MTIIVVKAENKASSYPAEKVTVLFLEGVAVLVVERLQRWTKSALRHLAKQRPSYLAGSSLTACKAYLASRYGGNWQMTETATLPGSFEALLMDDYRPGIGCCTLTALTAIFHYHQLRAAGKATAEDPLALFSQIESQAVQHGYSLTRGRVNPLRMDGLVRSIWRSQGHIGVTKSVYWPSQKLIIRELQAGRPMLLNIAFGPYHRHTVTLTGFETWQTTDRPRPQNRLLLQVADGWSREYRWIDYTAMAKPGSGSFSFFSLTLIRPAD